MLPGFRPAPLLFVSLMLVLCAPVYAQQDGLLQLNDPIHTFLLRQQALGRLQDAHLSHQPLSAYEARRYLDTLATTAERLSPLDRALLDRYRGETPAPGADGLHRRFGLLYENGQDLYAVEGPDFALQVNPLLYLSAGPSQQSKRPERPERTTAWQTTFGVRASGHIGPHVFFETRLEENHRAEPSLARSQAIQRLPSLKSKGDIDTLADITLNYFRATGLVGMKTSHFEIRVGRDHNRWGPGRNSLILSNYAPTYDQLQLRTTFWRLQYTNLFTVLSDRLTGREGDPEAEFPAKYGSFHRLALNLPGRIQAGVFEAVIFSPSTFKNTGSYLGFFNPLIFYRAVDWDLGSPGNMVLGFDAAWQPLTGLNVYAELMLDEYDASNLFSNPDYWKNTYGLLMGLYLADAGLKNLDLRVEYSRVRPYTYSNRSTTLSYLHYRGVLGHPAGPNTEDIAVSAAYRLSPQFLLAFDAALTHRGRNTDARNFGADPARPYDEDRLDEDGEPLIDGVTLLQGVRQTALFFEGRAGYEFLPGFYLEAALRTASLDDTETGLDRYVTPFLLLRWGLPFQSLRY